MNRINEVKKTLMSLRPDDLGFYSCPKCNAKYNSIPTVRAHLHLDCLGQKFQCTHCSYQTKRKFNLKNHLYRKHTDFFKNFGPL